MLAVLLAAPAAGARVVERVYVSTDRAVYMAGEDIRCSAFCLDFAPGRLYSELSSLAYLELHSADGLAQTAKIALVHGRGAGVISLPRTLPTGNYRIIAYTAENKQEEGYDYGLSARTVSVFNPYLSERVKGDDGKYEEKSVKVTLKNCFKLVPEFRDELEKEGNDLNREVLTYAQQLEGSVRQVGMHACATIIGPGNLSDYIPICLSKDKDTGQDVWTSQYDGHYIEECGLLKMDFLGLNTLSIIH